jgi:peroxiredoxin
MKKLFLSAAILVTAFTKSFSGGYTVGETVKSFTLKNVDGKMVSLDDYKKQKGVIVIFTCNHCPFAKLYEERIMNLDKAFASKGFPVVAISPNDPTIVPDDSYDNMVTRAKEKNYSFPYLLDETQHVAKDFGAQRTPHVFLLSNDGKNFKMEYIGAIDDNADDANATTKKYVASAIDELLAGKKVSVTSTKAIGCGIKWKEN